MKPVSSDFLGMIHGQISIGDQGLGIVTVQGEQTDADTGRDENFVVVNIKHPAQFFIYPFSHQTGIVRRFEVWEEYGKLIPTQA